MNSIKFIDSHVSFDILGRLFRMPGNFRRSTEYKGVLKLSVSELGLTPGLCCKISYCVTKSCMLVLHVMSFDLILLQKEDLQHVDCRENIGI